VCKTTDKGCEPIECPDCEECKTLEEGGTGQCEQIVPTAEERAEAEKKLKNSGYTHDEQPDCDYTQESLYMSYREAGYCIEGGKYSACLDRAPVLECGNLVRYDKPSYSNRNSVCDGREAGYKGWRSQGLNGAKSQQLAMLWDGGYISMGQMFYSSMCNLLETDYNNTLSIRTDYCCPYKENVACSASNGISQCCQYAGKLPDDKKIKCYLDNTEIEMSYICCPSESASVVEVMDSDGKGTGSYICCDVGTNATKVEGGNEGEYICCAEGETAWKDSYGKRQCCATDSEVKNMEVDGTVLYQCCKKEETAFLQYNGDVPYLGCCTEGNVQTVDADGKTLNVCCKDGETAYWHGSKSDETTKNLSYVKCCPGEVYQEKETTETNSKLCCGEVGEEGKDVSSATGTYGTYNLCCESGTELKILFETENGDLETKCCTKGVDLYIKKYEYIDDENKNPLYGCCPVDAPKAKEYKEGGLTYHLCCTEDKIAKLNGTEWECGCSENKYESAYEKDGEFYFLCCEKGLSAVEQDDGTWKCECPEDTPNRQTYEKDGVSYSLCCENGLSAVEQDDGTWTCGCPKNTPNRQKYEKDGVTHYLCCENGLSAVEKEGKWICGCPNGQEPVDNYIDGGGVSGKYCCEVKEDENTSFDEDIRKHVYHKKNYEVAGAVKGTCCGGYTSTEHRATIQTEVVYEDILTEEYNIFINGGVPYCANPYVSTETWDGTNVVLYTVSYPSVGSYSYTVVENGGSWGIDCTAEKGDPQSGSCTEWTK